MSLDSLPSELLMQIAVLGAPLVPFRLAVRFDVHTAAALRIQRRWQHAKLSFRRSLSPGDRVLFRKKGSPGNDITPACPSGILYGVAHACSSPRRWNVKLADGSMYFLVPQSRLHILESLKSACTIKDQQFPFLPPLALPPPFLGRDGGG